MYFTKRAFVVRTKYTFPTSARYWPNVCLMLAHCLRRWTNIGSISRARWVVAGQPCCLLVGHSESENTHGVWSMLVQHHVTLVQHWLIAFFFAVQAHHHRLLHAEKEKKGDGPIDFALQPERLARYNQWSRDIQWESAGDVTPFKFYYWANKRYVDKGCQ